MAKCTLASHYDNDQTLKRIPVRPAKYQGSPFETADWPIKTASSNWTDEARGHIRSSDRATVVCRERTDSATSMATEVTIAQMDTIPRFGLNRRANEACRRSTSIRSMDKPKRWMWDELNPLIGGAQ
jgi:hypothetical protein